MNQQAKNRELVLAVYQNIDAHAFERAVDLVSPQCKVYFSGNVLDRDAWSGMARMFMRAFPDGRHVFDLTDAAGDYVLLHGYFTGTHRDEFQGIAATGKLIKISMTMIDKVEGGKMVEHRGDFDTAGLLQQLTQ
jgi:predicted ester cyclase